MNKSRLISIISNASNKYGDKLVDFMDNYNLYNLQSATEEQLQEYIEEKGLVEMITEKQKNYILYLYREIDIEPEEDLDNLTKQQASNLIEELKQIKEEIS